MRKIAPAADIAKTTSAPTATGLKRENIPKLAKIIDNQKTRTTRNGNGMALPLSVLYRLRLLGRQIEAYAAMAAV